MERSVRILRLVRSGSVHCALFAEIAGNSDHYQEILNHSFCRAETLKQLLTSFSIEFQPSTTASALAYSYFHCVGPVAAGVSATPSIPGTYQTKSSCRPQLHACGAEPQRDATCAGL
jgi:hypothetical protein